MLQDTEKLYKVYEASKDGKPIFIVVNDSLRSFNDKEKYPWYLWISVVINDKSGYPSNSEADELNTFEDLIESKFNSIGENKFVGRSTWYGTRELHYYISEPVQIDGYLQTLVNENNPIKQFQYRIEKDEKWEKVKYLINL